MRAFEILSETASAGATSSGSVATVAKPLTKKRAATFFGAEETDMPEYGSTEPVVIRRIDPSNK